ncbi:hypothetical protein [Candidatus Venteria ishoeyi]|uniref:Doubled CXXCH motif (Paired_CXXCH_1) n=1 Tax=Candidatus Venteria ishoeyi TaxID=1899563 RepID=A0A1H6FCY5_9GAMM|nr:hypothetical protein [Candidatus Venteria ishoeyi]MDM8545296.1 hypothetical protein [Candidatus Venteria ishoeyi]SEH07938.1 Doubled CXXCH motif (Paired_CXXCH_1) [Candidatus Venteria ishoeyi]
MAQEYKLPAVHHQVAVTIPADMQIPENFKLDKNKQLQCATCHGIADIENIPLEEIDPQATDFLNGGPYQKLTNFCYACHDKQDNQKLNIHKMLNKQQQVNQDHCDFCHLEIPDPAEPPGKEVLKFRLPKAKLCWGCHLKTPHLNAITHQQKLSDKMLEQLQKTQDQQQIRFPLGEDKQVICITCHNSHQYGVLDADSEAGKQIANTDLDTGISYQPHAWNEVYQQDKQKRLEEAGRSVHELTYQRLSTEVLLRLTAKDGSLCRVCHSFKD